MIELNSIKMLAKAEGFTLCGVTRVHTFEWEPFDAWLSSGQGDMLPYMAQHRELRFDATSLLNGARTAVVCAMNYKSEWSVGQSGDCKIASYALFRDYHKSMRRRLRALLRALQHEHPSVKGRVCVDSAPLLEKSYAVAAGLGWIGRQSLLVTPHYGTYVLLGVLLLDMEASAYDSPLESVGCGKCRRCVDSCPSGAIVATSSPQFNTIDSRRCISALTVECDNPESRELNGWLFGCDECQSCCPYNHRSPCSCDEEFTPLFSPPSSREEWEAMLRDGLPAPYASSPLKRRFK